MSPGRCGRVHGPLPDMRRVCVGWGGVSFRVAMLRRQKRKWEGTNLTSFFIHTSHDVRIMLLTADQGIRWNWS